MQKYLGGATRSTWSEVPFELAQHKSLAETEIQLERVPLQLCSDGNPVWTGYNVAKLQIKSFELAQSNFAGNT